ncbi:GNAT family N-acetyltransferase [Streptomyces specialis]|uniref:GNAT family N-acetyltransferase n=1 Tax=Streptomyces specialis TaxID=498367 RepID=UPI00073EAB08|nr:GNAT family N-acetyltransferase [Streptomyces specialis]
MLPFRLQLLRADHAPALLAFERENRAWFAASIPDRGDDYFADFDARHAALLAEQAAGVCFFHLLLNDDGAVLGRVNLIDVADGAAELGFRVAEKAAGRGLATAAVREVCALAATAYGLTALHARATLDNAASRTVLARTGFTPTAAITLTGRPATRYERPL